MGNSAISTVSSKQWFKNKNGYTSEAWVEKTAEVAGISGWSKYKRMYAVQLIERCINPYLKHKTVPGAAVIPKDEFRTKFKRPQGEYLKKEIFQSSNHYSMDHGIAKDYVLNEKFKTRLYEALKNSEPKSSHLVSANDGCRVQKVSPTKRKNKNIAENGSLHNVPAWCPVNLPALYEAKNALFDWLEYLNGDTACSPSQLMQEISSKQSEYENSYGNKDQNREIIGYLERTILEICHILFMAHNTNEDGFIPQTFTESDAGRWYANGTSLQNCSRLTRKAALHGFWQFDIEACHHTILNHIGQQAGMDTEHLTAYVDDRSALREAIAEEVGVSVRQVKDSLIARVYGARQQPFSTLEKIIGDKRECFISNERYQLLDKEVQNVFKHLLTSASKDDLYIVNAKGKKSKQADKKKKMAHLLQGHESMCLEAALKVHSSVVLPLHDGWVCTSKESVDAAETSILEITGIPVKVECIRYNLSGLAANDPNYEHLALAC